MKKDDIVGKAGIVELVNTSGLGPGALVVQVQVLLPVLNNL